ncbi:MAG: restriction endonuclease subunit S [Erysipelotrichaceae bacterium]|nr:restriction endonuclease subunit S [Erysipelotrichaceae bacterium]
MKTCKVSDLFWVNYGTNLALNTMFLDEEGINFVSRTSKNNGVSAKVKLVNNIKPLPAGTITVAAGGSVMETFLQLSPYYSGRDIYYLTAKIPLTNEQKLFYCLCLRNNKYKYSYGRQSNNTLSDLLVPTYDNIPQFVNDFSLKEYGKKMLSQVEFQNFDISFVSHESKYVSLDELFSIINGIPSTNVIKSSVKENSNWIPYIRPSYKQETSIGGYVNKNTISESKIFPAETLYVSTNGQGSHTYSYVSTFEFVPNSDVTVLLPKRQMSLQEKLYYSLCITNNRYKFSYGRKPKGDRLKSIMLPEYAPDYVYNYNINNVIHGFNQIIELL